MDWGYAWGDDYRFMGPGNAMDDRPASVAGDKYRRHDKESVYVDGSGYWRTSWKTDGKYALEAFRDFGRHPVKNWPDQFGFIGLGAKYVGQTATGAILNMDEKEFSTPTRKRGGSRLASNAPRRIQPVSRAMIVYGDPGQQPIGDLGRRLRGPPPPPNFGRVRGRYRPQKNMGKRKYSGKGPSKKFISKVARSLAPSMTNRSLHFENLVVPNGKALWFQANEDTDDTKGYLLHRSKLRYNRLAQNVRGEGLASGLPATVSSEDFQNKFYWDLCRTKYTLHNPNNFDLYITVYYISYKQNRTGKGGAVAPMFLDWKGDGTLLFRSKWQDSIADACTGLKVTNDLSIDLLGTNDAFNGATGTAITAGNETVFYRMYAEPWLGLKDVGEITHKMVKFWKKKSIKLVSGGNVSFTLKNRPGVVSGSLYKRYTIEGSPDQPTLTGEDYMPQHYQTLLFKVRSPMLNTSAVLTADNLKEVSTAAPCAITCRIDTVDVGRKYLYTAAQSFLQDDTPTGANIPNVIRQYTLVGAPTVASEVGASNADAERD